MNAPLVGRLAEREAVDAVRQREGALEPRREVLVGTRRRSARAREAGQHRARERLAAHVPLREPRQRGSEVFGVGAASRDPVALDHAAVGSVSSSASRLEVCTRDREIRRIVRHHRAEDAGHDRWFLDDLASLKLSPPDVSWP